MPEIGESRKKGGLLRTGQTTQYGGYADDGFYEKGLSRRYTVLTTGQYSGTKNITLNGKTDAHSNNCVLDVRTKLMWSRYAAGSVGPGSDGKLPWTTNGSGEGIFAYAAAANAALLGGYSDWRVPNLIEMISILDYEQPSAIPPVTQFPTWNETGLYQVATTYPQSADYTLPISSVPGNIAVQLKTSSYFVILVRGG
jgi:hypothetical protein